MMSRPAERDTDPGLEDLRPFSLAETSANRVRDAIRRDIVRGIFGHGGRLKVMELAARYGLSPAPIREALNQLAGEGLIVIEPNRGAHVRMLDEAFIREIFEIRLGLEPMLVAKCVAVGDAARLADAQQIQEAFEVAVSADDLPGVVRLNSRFHGKIYEMRPNVEALRLMAHHSALMATMRFQYGFAPGRLDQVVQEHRALLAACHARDAAAAERIVRQHIQHSYDDVRGRYALLKQSAEVDSAQ